MDGLVVVAADRTAEWNRLKSLVLDSVGSPVTRRVYNLGLDEFIAWYTREARPEGFTKATVAAWRVALVARGLGPVSVNVRITAVRKLAIEAPTTACSPRNWLRGSTGSRASSRAGSAPGTGSRCGRRRRF